MVLLFRRVDLDARQEETVVEAILEELAREIHSLVGVRMHRLGVCEWEVKLWMASSGQENVAWRVVVTNATGHTCTVHVCLHIYRIYFVVGFSYIFKLKVLWLVCKEMAPQYQ